MGSYQYNLKACWYAFLGIVLFLFLSAIFSGCTTTKYVTVEVEKVKTDTTYITKQLRDSIWLHDSVYVKEKGDTLLIEKWHTKYVEKEIHDTLYQSKTDSIPVPYPVEKLVEKQLSFRQQSLIKLGYAMLAVLIGLIVYGGYKLKRKF